MRYRIWVLVVFALVCALSWELGSWAGYRSLERESLDEAFRYRQLIANQVNRFQPIPALVAEHPLLREALHQRDHTEVIERTNALMRRLAGVIDNSDAYLMDDRGKTLAASNHREPVSFVGRNFAFRPYFRDAMRSADSALYFALGTTSRKRGLYFSHPVMTREEEPRVPLGVVVVKVKVTDLEAQWQRPAAANRAEMVVLDRDGVSFLASRDDWLYRAFRPLEPEDRERLVDEKRYPGQALTPVSVRSLGRPRGVTEASTLVAIGSAGQSRRYLQVSAPVSELDGQLRVLIGTRAVLWTQVQSLTAGTLLFLGGFLTWLYLRERYRREAELAERGVQLERRVAERTADLEASNQQLLDEIRERERAQTELRETQQELIQAAKLAVLGQMSAGLNHEMNQPLTAIQAYARNSRRFLDKGEEGTVRANLDEIDQLCRKMSELTRQFKIFARKSESSPTRVDLRQPVDAALKILSAQDDSTGVRIHWQRPEGPQWAHGDVIRIEQVLVNLLTNAVQAVSGVDDPQVSIQVDDLGDQWRISVLDNGPGLPADTEQVFEPFFTTKSLKQGLGLGLSISRQIADALGGQLVGRNRHDTRGAELSLILNKREETP